MYMYFTAFFLLITVPSLECVFKRYVPRCPAYGVERFLQAEAVCGSITQYHCLYDDDFKLAEICQDFKQLPSGNLPKYSSYGDDVYYDPCESGRYQLGPVKSYQITDCLFIKSTCSSEGQVPCSEGTISTDVTCRCDYKNGYAMVHSGCCSPTLFDDCSCYRKPCPDGKELGPDYGCIDKCPDEMERKDGQQQCSIKVPTNISGAETSVDQEKMSISKLVIDEMSPHITFDTLVSKVFILIGCVLYFIHGVVVYVYGLETTWRPFRYKLIPYIVLSTITMTCLVLSAVALYEYEKDTKWWVKIIMTIFTALMIGSLCLLAYIVITHDIAEECTVYNENYDKRIYQLLKAAAGNDLEEIRRLKNEQYIAMEDVDYDQRSALHLAACENHYKIVKYILTHHLCLPDATDRWNRTALADIAFHKENKSDEKDYSKVEKLIKMYIYVSGKEKNHFREVKALELINAAKNGQLDKIKRLEKRGTDMNLQDASGQTALHAATKNGIISVVKYLLDNPNVSPFVRFGGDRPIDIVPHEATKVNKQIRELLEKRMKELIAKKDIEKDESAEMDIFDSDLTMVRLLNSAARGDIRTMRRLKYSGCQMDACDYDKRTALHIAVSENQELIVDFLLEECKQQDIAKSWKDRWNMTPFEASKKPNREAVYDMMLKHCPELVDTESDEFYTCMLLNAAKNGDIEQIKRLHDKKVDMNMRDYDGRTALHLAAAENNVEVVRYLIETAKVAVSIPDRDNRKPGDVTNDEIKELIRKGEDNPIQTTKLTLAEKRLTMGMKAAAKGLLCKLKDEAGYRHFKLDGCDYLKDTPLHVSAVKGRLEDVQYLINECKVSPFVRNSLGKRPIDLVNEKISLWNQKEGSDQSHKKHGKEFDDVEKELEEAMRKATEEDVEEDQSFVGLNEEVKTFLFLNKACKGDIRAIRSYLKTDPGLCNAVDYDNRTALHIAVAEGHQELADFLKNQGAKEDVKDRWGRTPKKSKTNTEPDTDE